MRTRTEVAAAVALVVGLAACDGTSSVATAPDIGEVAARGGPKNSTTTDVFQWCKLVDGQPSEAFAPFPPVQCIVDAENRGRDMGDARLTRTGGGFSWQFRAGGLTPGNAYTVWVGNFRRLDGESIVPPEDPHIDTESVSDFERAALPPFSLAGLDAGHGGAGLVGGNGKVTVAGNHCVHPIEFTLDGGGLTITRPGFVPGLPPECDFVRLDKPIWLFLIDHGPFTGDQSQLRTPFVPGEGELYAFFDAPNPMD